VAVLRPYSTAELLGPELQRRGLDGLAVVPRNRAAWGMTGPPLDPAGWWQVVTEPAEPGDLVALLARVNARALVAGDESAVPLAEWAADKLGFPCSPPGSSADRTSKIAMQARLRAAGVPYAMTFEATSVAETVAAAQMVAAGSGWPVVIKPDWSASSVGVHICRSLAEVLAAANATFGHAGGLGGITRAVAVQPYLDGSKWTADIVAVPGPGGGPVHVLTSVWRERIKVADTGTGQGGGIAWGESWLVPPGAITDPRSPAFRVVAYARAVFRAAEVWSGPACAEIVLTARGPRLIEVMGRLAGCYPVDLVERVTGQSQVTATVDGLVAPAVLARRDPPAGNGEAVAQAWLAAPHDGWIRGRVLQRIRGLPYVVRVSEGLVTGAPVRRTTDSPSSPGRLDLCGPPARVGQSIARIRRLERHLYTTRRPR
jgi:hypothetical protein